MKRKCSNSGFTLIEVLISVAIISVIMVLVWQTTAQSIKGKQKAEKRYQTYHEARVSIDKIVQDISMAFLIKGEAHLGKKQGIAQMKTVFKGEESELNFDSMSNVRLFSNSRQSEECEIGYKVEPDPENHDWLKLMRRQAKNIDDKPEDGGDWLELITRVKRFQLEYYDGQKFEWQSSWNSENTEGGTLPRAVRVTLALEDFRDPKEEMVFQTIAFVEMYSYHQHDYLH